MVDLLSLDELDVKDRIQQELQRYRKFEASVLGLKEKTIKQSEIDTKNYAKYILREGQIFEKREILSHLANQFVLKNDKLELF